MPVGVIIAIVIVIILVIGVLAMSKSSTTPTTNVPTITPVITPVVTPVVGMAPASGGSSTPVVTAPVVTNPVVTNPVAASQGPYLWDPTQVSTQNPSAAVVVGNVGTSTIYVAAARTSSGQLILGKSDGTSIWYYDGGEKQIPVSQGYLLPASAIGNPSWGSVLNRGVALVSAPGNYVCRSAFSDGLHSGYFNSGVCNITWAGQLSPQSVFDYLNIA